MSNYSWEQQTFVSAFGTKYLELLRDNFRSRNTHVFETNSLKLVGANVCSSNVATLTFWGTNYWELVRDKFDSINSNAHVFGENYLQLGISVG